MRLLNALLCFLLLVLSTTTNAQWQIVNGLPGENFHYISFKSSTGLMASDKMVLKSTNAGNTWDTVYFDPTELIFDTQLMDTAVFYINGNYSTPGTFLKKTFDGGANWTVINNVPTGLMYFTSIDTGHHFQGNLIARTTNAGITWTTYDIVISTVSGNIFFTSPSTGYIAGWYNGLIFKSTDYGASWFSLSATGEFLDVYFPSDNIGYASGWYGTIQKTTDGGVSWNVLNTNLGSGIELSSIFCTDNNTCYAVGDSGTIVKTIDGGVTWNQQVSGTLQKLNSVYCIDNNTCYAVGDSGIVLKTINGGIGVAEHPPVCNDVLVYPNPASVQLTVKLNEKVHTLNDFLLLYDTRGRVIGKCIAGGNNSFSLDVSNVVPGIYVLKINSEKGILTKKVVINPN